MSYFNIIGLDCENIIMEYKRQLETNYELHDEIKNYKKIEYEYNANKYSFGNKHCPNVLSKMINGSPYILIKEERCHMSIDCWVWDKNGSLIYHS